MVEGVSGLVAGTALHGTVSYGETSELSEDSTRGWSPGGRWRALSPRVA